jgi:CRP-like cAMP-binding protein
MKESHEILKKVSLFKDINDEDILSILSCLNAAKKTYSRGDWILSAGDEVKDIGIIISGNVHIIKDDFSGNRNIVANLSACDLFAEVFVYAKTPELPVSVYAASDCEILFINYGKIVNTCSSACSFHSKIIENMLFTISNKNLMLNKKIELLTQRTTREKLLTYLNMQAEAASSNQFTIALNRQELADFLCVDRSAMASELGKLRDEGTIKFNKNMFEIHP